MARFRIAYGCSTLLGRALTSKQSWTMRSKCLLEISINIRLRTVVGIITSKLKYIANYAFATALDIDRHSQRGFEARSTAL